MAGRASATKNKPLDRTPEKQGRFPFSGLFAGKRTPKSKSGCYDMKSSTANGAATTLTSTTDNVSETSVKMKATDGVRTPSANTSGRGHSFQTLSLMNPTWCDKCGDFIWGLYKHSVRCKFCKYTCHHKCVQYVNLDCTVVDPSKDLKSSPESTLLTNSKLSDTNLKPGQLSSEELRNKIDAFNSESNGLILTMDVNSEMFRGFVRVHMNLSRPINVLAGSRPASVFGVTDTNLHERAKTSFFLPKGTVKALHINSDTTAHEVIVALLNKFKVTDNPRKFALFEKTETENENILLRRLSDYERPLYLHLLWGPNCPCKTFVLQENETGNIVWEAFSVPELKNFLKILDKEEEDHLTQVKKKYAIYQQKLKEAMSTVKR